MKRKDLSMCERVTEEIYRFGDMTSRELAQKLGCSHNTVSDWLRWRSIPSAFHLKSMHEAGMDIMYIITGRRTNHDESRG